MNMEILIPHDIYPFKTLQNRSLFNQVLRKLVKLHSFQNVNQFLIASTFIRDLWFKLVQIINLIENSTDLKHQHLAGAFFLALIPDSNSAWSEYLYVLVVLRHRQYLYLVQIEMMRVYLLDHEKWFS